MKSFLTVILSIIILLISCHAPADQKAPNQFTLEHDTLLVYTEKEKGAGLFQLGLGILVFQDTSEAFPYPLNFPEGISEIEGARNQVDFKSEYPEYIHIIRGRRGNEEIYVVDQNNNKNFADDPVRPIQVVDWYSSRNSILCHYSRPEGQESGQDSAWVKIGIQNGSMWYGRDEYLTADFSLEGIAYKIGMVDNMLASTFSYGLKPVMAILANNSSLKDTLLHRELINKGEYINLEGVYYKFDSISLFGDYVMLVKEDNFSNKVGTQVGMRAPEFNFTSVSGDTVNSMDLNGKPVVIANSCGCGGDVKSTEAFDEMSRAFGDKIFALRLDTGIKDNPDGWHVDTEDGYNSDIFNKYRQAYCSRITYVIGKDNRIIDKFPITEWESYLANHF